MERDYGKDDKGMINTMNIPPHSRWRHYSQVEIDGLLSPIRDKNERCKLLLDLFIVSVLLDAGAGPLGGMLMGMGGRMRGRRGWHWQP